MNPSLSPRGPGRRAVFLGAATLLATPSISRAQRRSGVALVIGNSKYRWEAPLPNVRRDAPDIAKAFRELGLKTVLVQEATNAEMHAAVERFSREAAGAELAAFYFAGHGAFWDKDTYLVPVDADLSSPNSVQNLLPTNTLTSAMERAAHRLLVFDNCRNNPADGWRQRAAAESAIVGASDLSGSAPNTLKIFSTAPGRVALDGPPGENSPFASSFLRQLGSQSFDLATFPEQLRRDVLLATEGQQIIWEESTFAASYPLNGLRGKAPAAVPILPTSVSSSRLVELPKAYAFARDKQLAVPAGLVALHSVNHGANDRKIGAFATAIKVRLGVSNGQFVLEPAVVVVLSIDDEGVAESVICTRLHTADKNGAVWFFVKGQVSNNKISFARGPFARGGTLDLRWKDDSSGTFDVALENTYIKSSYERFVRLDG